MNSDTIDKEAVIQQRMAQAKAAYADATFLLENDRLAMAVNRIRKSISDAFENRSNSDYGLFVSFSKDDVSDMLTDMKDFMTVIEQFILSQP